jgi:hypothetical protein
MERGSSVVRHQYPAAVADRRDAGWLDQEVHESSVSSGRRFRESWLPASSAEGRSLLGDPAPAEWLTLSVWTSLAITDVGVRAAMAHPVLISDRAWLSSVR